MELQINETIDKVLSILEKCDEAFLVLQTVLIALLNRKFTKLSNNAKIESSQPFENKGVETTTLAQAQSGAVAPIVDTVSLRNQFEMDFKSALDLYFSGKSYADMTDEERQQINDVQTFINGGSHGKSS